MIKSSVTHLGWDKSSDVDDLFPSFSFEVSFDVQRDQWFTQDDQRLSKLGNPLAYRGILYFRIYLIMQTTPRSWMVQTLKDA